MNVFQQLFKSNNEETIYALGKFHSKGMLRTMFACFLHDCLCFPRTAGCLSTTLQLRERLCLSTRLSSMLARTLWLWTAGKRTRK